MAKEEQEREHDSQAQEDIFSQTETPSEVLAEVPGGGLSFSSFILGLSTQALMYMGEVAGPGQSPD